MPRGDRNFENKARVWIRGAGGVNRCESEEGERMKGGKDKARSPHYFVQITHAAVICKIPVILHFKLENKTAWLAAAYPLHGISMLSPPVTLTLLRKTDPTTAENYCTALRSVRIIFSSLSLSLFLFSFAPPSYARHPPLLSISAFDLRVRWNVQKQWIDADRERAITPRRTARENSKFYQPALEEIPTLST